MLVFFVFGGILLLVGAYFAFDWWMGGRTAKRSLQYPPDKTGNTDVHTRLFRVRPPPVRRYDDK